MLPDNTVGVKQVAMLVDVLSVCATRISKFQMGATAPTPP